MTKKGGGRSHKKKKRSGSGGGEEGPRKPGRPGKAERAARQGGATQESPAAGRDGPTGNERSASRNDSASSRGGPARNERSGSRGARPFGRRPRDDRDRGEPYKGPLREHLQAYLAQDPSAYDPDQDERGDTSALPSTQPAPASLPARRSTAAKERDADASERLRDREEGRRRDQKRAFKDASRQTPLDSARKKTETAIARWLTQGDELRAARAAHDARSPAERLEDESRLDPWQQDVVGALDAGSSVIVDAPTTAGKTRAVEVFFRAHLQNPGFRAAYTTPVKSLSNDKLREFRAMFGEENVGIATGDVKENLGAPIVVATLESYRNSLLGVEPDLGRTLVVFDEYHYLQDESRGSAWEEALILTPPACQVLLLSASVANAEQFVDWLRQLNPQKECVLVRTEKRPVPLVDLVWHDGGFVLPETLPPQAFRMLDKQKMNLPPRQEDVAGRLASLADLRLTPCIVYAGRRLACETLAGALCRVLAPLAPAESEAIGRSLQASHAETGALSFVNPRLRQMMQVYGVAFHHSGLAAPARMAVEALVKNGLLRFCTATMGLSLGINFSVRSAMVTDYQRPGEAGFTDYAPSEVLQMLGRAGRRGKDVVGFSLWPHVEAFARLGGARREPISSRLRNDPTTFLGLVGRGFSLRAIEHFYAKSFRRFTDRSVDFSLMTRARLERAMPGREICCASPAAEYARFKQGPSLCATCPARPECHPIIKSFAADSRLAALHIHLHRIDALATDESLTDFGRIARYFPQSGGLVMARRIANGTIHAATITEAAELAGALGLARFKEPGYDPHYRFPFDVDELAADLERHYPYDLFQEIYDPPYGRRDVPVIRELNPQAGYLVRSWAQGMPWKELIARVTHEQYGTGDLMSLIYRVATYLQSMIQADLTDLKPAARALRDTLLREPLSFALQV